MIINKNLPANQHALFLYGGKFNCKRSTKLCSCSFIDCSFIQGNLLINHIRPMKKRSL